MEKQVYFTVDSDELISLRDFGYLADDELEDAEAITNALHTVISDLWKMKVETEKPNRQAEIFGYKTNEVMETIIVNEDMRVGDSILFINNDGTDFLDAHLFIKDREGMSGCYDISLYVSKAYHKWAEEIGVKKVLNLHISCADKLNEGIPDMFVGDLLEILYHIDNNIICNLGKEKKYCYKYVRLKRNSQMERVNSICGSI